MDTRESRMIAHYLQVNNFFFPRNNSYHHENEKLCKKSKASSTLGRRNLKMQLYFSSWAYVASSNVFSGK